MKSLRYLKTDGPTDLLTDHRQKRVIKTEVKYVTRISSAFSWFPALAVQAQSIFQSYFWSMIYLIKSLSPFEGSGLLENHSNFMIKYYNKVQIMLKIETMDTHTIQVKPPCLYKSLYIFHHGTFIINMLNTNNLYDDNTRLYKS